MVLLMEFLDTVDADVVRIRKGRCNIQRGISFLFFSIFVVMFLIVIGTLVISVIFLLLFSVLFVALVVLLVGLVLKREIYSMMIFLKEV